MTLRTVGCSRLELRGPRSQRLTKWTAMPTCAYCKNGEQNCLFKIALMFSFLCIVFICQAPNLIHLSSDRTPLSWYTKDLCRGTVFGNSQMPVGRVRNDQGWGNCFNSWPVRSPKPCPYLWTRGQQERPVRKPDRWKGAEVMDTVPVMDRTFPEAHTGLTKHREETSGKLQLSIYGFLLMRLRGPELLALKAWNSASLL